MEMLKEIFLHHDEPNDPLNFITGTLMILALATVALSLANLEYALRGLSDGLHANRTTVGIPCGLLP